MKFNIKWALAGLAAALVGLAAAPWTLSQSAQVAALERQVKARSGLRFVSHGRSVFAVLPRPHLAIYDLAFDREDGAASLKAGRLRVDLSLMSLLTGRVEMARAAFHDVELTLDPARMPTLAAVEGETAEGAAPGDVRIVNGRILLKRGDRTEVLADHVALHLEWERADAPLSLVGQGVLRALGEDHGPSRFALWAAQPGHLLHGSFSPITLRADDESFRLTLNGSASMEPRLHFEGQFASWAPSLRAAGGWFGLNLPLPGPYRDATLKGDAAFDPNLLSFPSLSLTVDGNALDGAASVRFDGPRPSVSATLAGSSVNLGSLLEEWPAASAGGQWSHESFPAAHLSAADLDLRFSASHVAIGDLNFDDAALSVLLKNGRLDLSLAEASAYSGDLRARAVVSESGGGLDIRGSVNAEKIDSASLLWDGFKSQSLSGAANLAATFETSGENFYELASRLDARGEFSVAAGEIYGIDLGLAFRRMEKRPLTAGVNLRSGRTGFETLAAKFSVVLGVAEIEEGVARNPRLSVFFSGRANVADRTLDLHATARGEPAGERAPAQLGFAISGGWDDPSIAPDAEGLIRRSDAAAPLLPKPAPE